MGPFSSLSADNQLYMVMEYVEGVTLADKLEKGPIPVNDAVNYISQVLSAVGYAHQQHIIHRDIKPANMMLTPNGRIKLLDFGIARASAESRLTMAGAAIGSTYYMSPEQIQGEGVDARSDLYSLGVSLYELAARKKPFEADSHYGIMIAHLSKTPVSPSSINPEVPPELDDIILKSMSKDPAARFQNAGQFLTALRNLQPSAGMGEPILSPPPAAPAQAPELRRTTPPTGPTATVPPPEEATRSITAATEWQPPAMGPVAPPAAVPREPEASAAPGSKPLLWAAGGAVCLLLAIVAFRPSGSHQAPQPAPPSQPAPEPARRPKAGIQSPAHSQNPVTGRAPAPEVPRKQAPPPEPASVHPPPARPQPPPDPGRSQLDKELPAEVNRNRMVVAGLSEQLDMLVVRANALRVKISAVQRSQSAPPTIGDWIDALNSINALLRRAPTAVDNGDAATGRAEIQKAAVQMEALEAALGR
jgi:hypothetical protein